LAIYRNFCFQCRFTGSGNALSSLLIVGLFDINPTLVQHPRDSHGARRILILNPSQRCVAAGGDRTPLVVDDCLLLPVPWLLNLRRTTRQQIAARVSGG
jgi:hypothetical protein